jgi:hypothetical protein
LLRLPDSSQVDDASNFEKKIRTEFAKFARSQGLEIWDNSHAPWVQHPERHMVALLAFERRVSLNVNWNSDTFFGNAVAMYGDGTAERPRQVYEALVQHLKATNIPFTIEDPKSKGQGDG